MIKSQDEKGQGERMKRKNSVKYSLLAMATVPILLLGFLVICISVKRFETSLHAEVESELSGMAYAVSDMLDIVFPGDYVTYGDKVLTLVKGESILNDRSEFIDSIKTDTGMEISIFYGDIRFLSTVLNQDGNRILGTSAHVMVQNEVLNEGKSKFYDNVVIGDEHYFAYYLPLFNSDGQCVGMVGVAKASSEVNTMVYGAIWPIVVVAALVMVLTGFATIKYAAGLIKDLTTLKIFMQEISNGNLKSEFDYMLMKRDDEITDMCTSAANMQKSLRKLVEQDPLTQLENRRSANSSILEMQKQAEEKGEEFTVVLGDIDYFKKVNDTYGHDAGDDILMMVSRILKKHMKGRGFAARWGGEEFLLGFDECSPKAAKKYTEAILEEIRNSEVRYGEDAIKVTMSFGIAGGDYEKTIDELIKEADESLYAAKENGRNQIKIFGNLEEEYDYQAGNSDETKQPQIDQELIDYIREVNEE